MRMMKLPCSAPAFVLLVLAFACAALRLPAQVSLDLSQLVPGGATARAASALALGDALGQRVAGRVAAGDFVVESGFWAAVAAAESAGGPTPTPSPSATGPTLSPTPSRTPFPTISPTESPSPTPSSTPTLTPTPKGSPLPITPTSTANPSPTPGSTLDSDGDGYSDGIELAFGADPFSAASRPALGDIDGDGRQNTIDAILFYRAVRGDISASALTLRDLNGDGLINALDAIRLYRWVIRMPGYEILY